MSISQVNELARMRDEMTQLRAASDAHHREIRMLHEALQRLTDEMGNYQRKRGRKSNGEIEIQAI